MSSSVLYDSPGPRARRVSLVFSLLALAAITYVISRFVFVPLRADGIFTHEQWGPLIDPDFTVQGQKAFPLVWQRIGEGWLATVMAAVIAVLTSLTFGTGLALLREQLSTSRGRRFTDRPAAQTAALRTLVLGGRVVSRTGVEFFRGLPVVITIFASWAILRSNGVRIDDAMWYAIIGLTLYNGVVIGEILRSGMAGLPKGQREAATSLGLGAGQTSRLILLPQTFRVMLPALISQLVVIVKDTSLGFLIAFEEALNVGKQLVLVLKNPIPMFVAIGLSYLIVNYLLSRLAQYIEARLARRDPVSFDAAPPAARPAAEAQAAA